MMLRYVLRHYATERKQCNDLPWLAQSMFSAAGLHQMLQKPCVARRLSTLPGYGPVAPAQHQPLCQQHFQQLLHQPLPFGDQLPQPSITLAGSCASQYSRRHPSRHTLKAPSQVVQAMNLTDSIAALAITQKQRYRTSKVE